MQPKLNHQLKSQVDAPRKEPLLADRGDGGADRPDENNDPGDDDLVEATLAGDESAFEQLVS